MRTHILQHVPFEGIGGMAGWLARRRAVVSFTRFHEDTRLPGPDGLDLVIAMGGPMSVNDEAVLPWLAAEKEFLRAVIGRGVPVLGVCLGAQLIASALGARVYPNRQREIGWYDIAGLAGAPGDFAFPERATVFHWHGETFDLPAGARWLARSAACAHQAFQVGRRVLGLQFHLEVTPDDVRGMVENGRSDLTPSEFVQDEARLLAAPASHFSHAHALMERLLDYLTA